MAPTPPLQKRKLPYLLPLSTAKRAQPERGARSSPQTKSPKKQTLPNACVFRTRAGAFPHHDHLPAPDWSDSLRGHAPLCIFMRNSRPIRVPGSRFPGRSPRRLARRRSPRPFTLEPGSAALQRPAVPAAGSYSRPAQRSRTGNRCPESGWAPPLPPAAARAAEWPRRRPPPCWRLPPVPRGTLGSTPLLRRLRGLWRMRTGDREGFGACARWGGLRGFLAHAHGRPLAPPPRWAGLRARCRHN